MSLIRKIILQDKQQGEVRVAFPIPREDNPYGLFAPLLKSSWESLLPIVSEENMNHALHGYATPLMREIGPSGHLLAKKVESYERTCKDYKTCTMAGVDCRIGSKLLPECFLSPNKDLSKAECIRQLVLLWREGYHVVVLSPSF